MVMDSVGDACRRDGIVGSCPCGIPVFGVVVVVVCEVGGDEDL